MPNADACPICGTAAPFAIIYGLPEHDLFEQESRGEVALGGCGIIVGESPAWRCRNPECVHEWGDVSDPDRIA